MYGYVVHIWRACFDTGESESSKVNQQIVRQLDRLSLSKDTHRMRRNGWGEGGVEELDEEGADTADEQGDANLANQDGTQPFQDGAQVVVVENKDTNE